MIKKYIALSAFVLILSGCQNSDVAVPTQIEKMALMQEKRMGIMQSLGGAHTSSQATHLLRMNDGKTIYLKSDIIDLNSQKYSDKEVEVMGKISRTTDGNQTMSVNSIDLIDTEVSINQEIPEWISYTSDNLGISLKYRNDYLLSDSDNQITIESKPKAIDSLSKTPNLTSESEPTRMIFELLSKDSNFDLADEMNVLSLDNADVLAGGFNRSKITQKGVDAYKFSGPGGKSIVYYLINDGGAYKISFQADENADNLVSEQNMFYDVLASMDLGGLPMAGTAAKSPVIETPVNAPNHVTDEQVDITAAGTDDPAIITTTPDTTINGFETFKSEGLNFSMQYPKNYYFSSVSPSTGATRTYQFGSQPLEEAPADLTLDLVNSIPTEAKMAEYNNKSFRKTNSGTQTSLYLNENGKIFKLTGPSTKIDLLEQMLGSVMN